MRTPRGIVRASDFNDSPAVANQWLNSVNTGLAAYVGGPAVVAFQQVRQSVPSGVATKIIFDAVEYDLDPRHSYNSTTGVFQPLTAGYYLINATVGMPSIQMIEIYKNGASYRKYGPYPVGINGFFALTISQPVMFNGSTDYIDIRATQTTAAPVFTDNPYTYSGLPDGATTFFSANLIRPA